MIIYSCSYACTALILPLYLQSLHVVLLPLYVIPFIFVSVFEITIMACFEDTLCVKVTSLRHTFFTSCNIFWLKFVHFLLYYKIKHLLFVSKEINKRLLSKIFN